MIAKSDLVILTISTAALAVGVIRWQANVSAPAAPTAPLARSSSAATQTAPRLLGELRQQQRQASGASERTVVTRIDPARQDAPTSADAGADVVARVLEPAEQRAASAGESSGNASLYGIYTVESGDYLSRIAEQTGTSVATLQSINGLDSDLIRVDQQLRYPLPAN